MDERRLSQDYFGSLWWPCVSHDCYSLDLKYVCSLSCPRISIISCAASLKQTVEVVLQHFRGTDTSHQWCTSPALFCTFCSISIRDLKARWVGDDWVASCLVRIRSWNIHEVIFLFPRSTRTYKSLSRAAFPCVLLFILQSYYDLFSWW